MQSVYRFTTTTGKVRYLLAPDVHTAAQLAYESSKPDQLKDIVLYERQEEELSEQMESAS
jgi:hypothetical protein